MTFSTTGTMAAFTPHSAGWTSYTKADRGEVDGGAGGAGGARGARGTGGAGGAGGAGGSLIAGHAAAAAAEAERGAPLSWLLQPGFVLRYLEVTLTVTPNPNPNPHPHPHPHPNLRYLEVSAQEGGEAHGDQLLRQVSLL